MKQSLQRLRQKLGLLLPNVSLRPSFVGRYGVAAISILVSFVIHYILYSFVGYQAHFLIFIPAIIVTALYSGIVPALVTSVAAVLLVRRFFPFPQGSWEPHAMRTIVATLVFFFSATVVAWLVDAIRRERELMLAKTRESLRRAEELERESEQRKLAEKALQENQRRLQAFADHSPTMIFLKDTDGRYLLCNREFEKITRKSCAEIIGRTDAELFDPAQAASFRANDLKVLEADATMEFEELALHRDGLHTSIASKFPLHDTSGKIYAVGGIVTDITRRKMTEEALQRAQRSYAELVRTIDGIVWEADPLSFQFTFISQKAERLFLYPIEHWLSEENFWINHIHPDDRDWVFKLCTAATQEGKYHDFDYRMIAKDGRTVWVRDIVSVIVQEKKPVILRGVMVDITEKKQAEQALTAARNVLAKQAAELEQRVAERTGQLQQSLSDMAGFCYSIAHDLRAPLRAMRGMTQALMEDYSSNMDETGKLYCYRINEAANRMDQLISDLLAYGRLSHTELPAEPTDLVPEIEYVIERSAYQIQQTNAEIDVRKPMPHVLADARVLDQVLENLITNAVKFVPADRSPHVHIHAEPHDNNVRVWVEDNGIGIEPAHRQKIFRPFERLHTAEVYPGTGIGLAIVQRAVEKMHGQVGVESEPGKGSRFWIELPAAS